jgi:hypothetical protein
MFMGQTSCFIKSFVSITTGILLAAASASGLDPEVEVLVRGFLANIRPFAEASIQVDVNETRYVQDTGGAMREVSLFPQDLYFVAKGEKIYFKHNGGGFSGVTLEPTPGIYEAAFDLGRFVVLKHSTKSMDVFPDVRIPSCNVEDPRNYFGWADAKRLSANVEKSPDLLTLGGQEQLYGVICRILEERVDERPVVWKYWFDQEHGFLPRKVQLIDTEDSQVFYELTVPQVFEVAPGVWAPLEACMDTNRKNTAGFHAVRQVRFVKVDISSAIPDEVFHLNRPRGYYVDDYVLNAHFQPEDLQEEILETQLRLRLAATAAQGLESPIEKPPQQPTAPAGHSPEPSVQTGVGADSGSSSSGSLGRWILIVLLIAAFSCTGVLFHSWRRKTRSTGGSASQK